ncbi:MAG: hypothetical protein FD134_267 [Gallionellaceae bacterium]|nr:MAG: hypothetical protein FD134_267 [Gallionellaceae bacterium]
MSNEPIEQQTVLQRVLDDINFIMMLGLVIPTVLYTLWGVMEVASLPLAR